MRSLRQRHPPASNRLSRITAALLSAAILVILAACQPETRVVEMPVEVEVTRVVEMPVEVEVTRVVEMPVEVEVSRVVEMPVEVEVTRIVGKPNIAPLGSVSASSGGDSASLAIDDDPESLWVSGRHPTGWIWLTLNRLHLVDRIELLVAQSPAGETSHQVWVGEGSGVLTKVHEFVDLPTSDGQTLSLTLDPPLALDQVLILTTKSPSWVAWREVKVLGHPTSQLTAGDSSDNAAWPQIKLRGNLEMPVQITNAADGTGRIFVVEQRGRIRVISDGALLPGPFLDISEHVSCCLEQGLLGVAFPPDFTNKRHFYVNYTNTEGNTVIARYRLTPDPNIADPNSAETILRIDQPATIHNGGHMAFGPRDGYLYIGMGDGGPIFDPDNRGQDPDTLLGKMLRIDVESGVSPYAIPDDNPFVQTAGYRGEIWALGLRNPWGFTFDEQTGDLYIPDVGGGKFEEVNFQPGSSTGGENYGWSIFEGIRCQDPDSCDSTGVTQPVAVYPHIEGCAAVVGGAVYRGTRFISMRGVFFYADLCIGHIWGLRRVGDSWHSALLYKVPFQITAIGEDGDGNLYVANYSDGTIMSLEGQIQASAPKPTSSAVATVTPAEAPVSLAAEGRVLFVERGCVACHVVASVPEAVGTSGPALDGFGDPSKWPLIAGVLANTPDNAKRWIIDPVSFKPDTAMLNVGLSDADADAIVAFLRTLK